jgi:O-antigen/teichoic acid export membrane protein
MKSSSVQFANEPMLIIAIVSIVRGMEHLDYRFRQREGFNNSLFKVGLWSAIGSWLISVPFAIWLQDYRVFLWAVGIQSAIHTLVSHMVARTPYRCGMNSTIVREILCLGLPLALNGLLMFSVLHGERLIVSLNYNAEQIGRFTVAAQLTLLPVLVLARAHMSRWLPAISDSLDDRDAFMNTVRRSLYWNARFVPLMIFGSCLILPAIIEMVYGREFSVSTRLLFGLSIVGSIRILRETASMTAVAFGTTWQPLVANIIRVGSLIVVSYLAVKQHDFYVLVLVGGGFELGASICAGLLVSWTYTRHFTRASGRVAIQSPQEV